MNDTLLEIKNISKSFDGLKAVDDFSCEVKKREIIGLIGPNGAGKTTAVNLLTGFLQPDSGEIVFDGKNITGIPPYKISRSGISRTFQDLRLITQMTLLENLLLCIDNRFGERIGNIFFRNKKIKQIEESNSKSAIELLEFAGLREKADEKAGNLSYGQQKLLSLACCLASNPKLILLDEPTSALDPEMIGEVLEVMKRLSDEGRSMIVVSHEMSFAREAADRISFMSDGKLVETQPPKDFFANPQHADTQRFLAQIL